MIQQCCAAGQIHTGTPTGRVDKVHGLDCYIAAPPEATTPQAVIVILPDIFGWELVNTRLLADSYASKSPYLVYLPELQAGMYMIPLSNLLTTLSPQANPSTPPSSPPSPTSKPPASLPP